MVLEGGGGRLGEGGGGGGLGEGECVGSEERGGREGRGWVAGE